MFRLKKTILFLQVRSFSKQEKCFADCLKDYLKQQRRCYAQTKVGNTGLKNFNGF